MSTGLYRKKTSFQVEKRNWLLGLHGTEPGANPTVTLDVSAFTPATHYPNGFFPSGLALGRITASGLYGPYDNAAVDGRETAVGLLFSSLTVPDEDDTTEDVAGAMLVHGFVDASKLPIAVDAAGQTDLITAGIHFAAVTP